MGFGRGEKERKNQPQGWFLLRVNLLLTSLIPGKGV